MSQRDSRGHMAASPQSSSQVLAGSSSGSGYKLADHSSAADSWNPRDIPALTLDKVIGQTCFHNNALAINPVTGDVAYPAGCVVVIYQPRRNRQSRYFRGRKAVSCLAYSRDGSMLAVGERGHQPSATVWSLETGEVLREVVGGHRIGISCICFTPSGGGLVTMGFKRDRMLKVWDLQLAAVATQDLSSPRSASTTIVESLDPDVPPPPPTSIKDTPTGVRMTSTSSQERVVAKQVASARVPQRVRSLDFTSYGDYLVTCGHRHVKFWKMPGAGVSFDAIGGAADSKRSSSGLRARAAATASDEASPRGKGSEEGENMPVDSVLDGWPATMADELEGENFVDVTSDKGTQAGEALGSVFSVTAGGVLCAFTCDGVMERWVSLEVPTAYGLSLHDGTLVVACADGLVRLFRAADLRYVATLPRPAPLGRANISSIRELQEITDSSKVVQGVAFQVDGGTETDDRAESVPSLVVRYPAALGCRMSPSGNRVACVYADRGLFIWDVTDPLCIGKYRSFLAHSACVWDIQRIPPRVTTAADGDESPSPPDIPDGAMLTCSEDGTVRVWDLGVLDGKSAGSGDVHSGRWSNMFSKHLLRVLGASQRVGGSVESPIDGKASPAVSSATASVVVDEQRDAWHFPAEEETLTSISVADSCSGGPLGTADSLASLSPLTREGEAEAEAEELSLSEGTFDTEAPRKPDWGCAPRRLAVHPSGSQVACGDRQGNIRVFDLTKMELSHVQPAHDAEILSLAYSPMLVPDSACSHPSGSPPAALSSFPTGERESPPSEVPNEIQIDGDEASPLAAETRGANSTSIARLQTWVAIDPLDLAAARGLLRRAGRTGGTGSTGDLQGGGRGEGGEQEAKERPDPLVLLASSGRDGLVRVFDASSASSDGPESPGFRLGGEQDKVERKNTVQDGQCPRSVGTRSEATVAAAGVARPFPLVKTLSCHTGSVTAVRFSKDGKRLISAGGDNMLVLNKVRGPDIQRFKAVSVPQGAIYGLDVDPTNNYVVTVGQDKRLHIWSIASAKHVRAYKVEGPPTPLSLRAQSAAAPPVRSKSGAVRPGGGNKGETGGELFKVDLDPTGMYAAACSFDKWIRLFDFYSGKCLATVSGHSELATGVRFTPDGRRLVSIGGDGVMLVWRLSPDLQQTMRDRMDELKATGSGQARACTDAAGTTVASDPTPSVDGDRSSSGEESSAAEVAAARGGRGMIGGQQGLDARGAEARARAMTEAKARLRFDRYQLPAWAQTREPFAPGSKPASASAEPRSNNENAAPEAISPRAGTSDEPSVAAAAHERGGDLPPSLAGFGRPTPTGIDGVDGNGEPDCRQPSDADTDDDFPQLPALRPPPPPSPASVSMARRRRPSEQLLAAVGEEPGSGATSVARSSPRTSRLAPYQFGRGGQVGETVPERHGRGIGWRSGRNAGARPGRVPGRASGGWGGITKESSRLLPKGFGVQGTSGRWGRCVQEEGPLEVRGHRVGRRVEGTSDASAEAVYRNNTAGASTTASSDPAQQREDEDDVEIGGSGDDHEASSLQGYSLDEDFEEMGDAGWPEAAVGDGFSDDKVESTLNVALEPTEGEDRRAEERNSHRLSEPGAGRADANLVLGHENWVRVGSDPVLGGDLSSIPPASPDAHDPVPGRVATAADESKGAADTGPGDSSPAVSAEEGACTPPIIGGRINFGKSESVKVGRSRGTRAAEAAAAAASPTSQGHESSSRIRKMIETEGAVENMIRRLSEMGLLDSDGARASCEKQERSWRKGARAGVPYFPSALGYRDSEDVGAGRKVADEAVVEDASVSVALAATPTFLVAVEHSPIRNTAIAEAISPPGSAMGDLGGGERRRITADTVMPCSPPDHDDERSTRVGCDPLSDRRLAGSNNFNAGSRISGLSPGKRESEKQLVPEGRVPLSGDIYLEGREFSEKCETGSCPDQAGRAFDTPLFPMGNPEITGLDAVSGADPSAARLPSIIEENNCKQENGRSVRGSVGPNPGFTTPGEACPHRRPPPQGEAVPGSGRGGSAVLPRPYGEYEDALSRLTDAARHAVELYRELVETSAPAAYTRDSAAETGTLPSARSHHFDPTSPGSSGSGRMREIARETFAEGEQAAAERERGGDGEEGLYEDDDEWEADEKKTNAMQPKAAINDPSTLRESILPLKILFRESFASVNDVLSFTFKGTKPASRVSEGNSESSTPATPVPEEGGLPQVRWGDSQTGRRADSPAPRFLTPLSQSAVTAVASPRENVESDDSGAAPGGLNAALLAASRGGGAEGGRGVIEEESRAVALDRSEGAERSFGCGSELPAEVTGMLYQYSEMMLKVMQEKMEARIANGTLGRNS